MVMKFSRPDINLLNLLKKYSLAFFYFFCVSKWRWKVEIAGGLEQKKENPNQ